MEEVKKIVYHKNAVEFVTVAVECCAFLEQSEAMKRSDFIDIALKILPLIYLKGTLLPHCENETDEYLEQFVREEDYEVVRMTVNTILKDKDDYLDVFLDEMVYSETPIKKTISEDLADIYQDLKNFVSIYSLGLESTMYAALATLKENFSIYWGQTTVNTLRALHDAKYSFQEEEDDAEIENGGKIE